MPLANLVSMGHPANLGSVVILASKEQKEKLDHKVHRDVNPVSLVTPVAMVQQENPVQEVRLVPMENPVSAVQKAIKVDRVLRDHLDYPVHLVPLAKWDEKDPKAHLVIKVGPVHMVSLAKMVHQV